MDSFENKELPESSSGPNNSISWFRVTCSFCITCLVGGTVGFFVGQYGTKSNGSCKVDEADSGVDLAPLVSWESSAWVIRIVSMQLSPDLDFTSFVQSLEQGSDQAGGLGISATFFDKGGEEIFSYTTQARNYCTDQECSTWADNWSPYTLHPIFSGTKMVTAALFLKLAEEGYVSLDEPFRESLSDIFNQSGRFGGDATPRAVFSHTGGFYGLKYLSTVTKCYAGESTLEQCVNQLSLTPLQHNTGTQFEYSDLAWEPIGLLLGRRYPGGLEAAFQTYIAGALGMSVSTYDCPAANSSIAHPHAATGLCTTVIEIGKLIQRLERDLLPDAPGLRLLSELSMRQLFSGQTGSAKLTGDELHFFSEILSRCISGIVGNNGSGLAYSFGNLHHLGFKSEAWLHPGSLGYMHFFSPGRYAAVFSTGWPTNPAQGIHLRALEQLELDNFPGLNTMCPVSSIWNGDFPIFQCTGCDIGCGLGCGPWNTQ